MWFSMGQKGNNEVILEPGKDRERMHPLHSENLGVILPIIFSC